MVWVDVFLGKKTAVVVVECVLGCNFFVLIHRTGLKTGFAMNVLFFVGSVFNITLGVLK